MPLETFRTAAANQRGPRPKRSQDEQLEDLDHFTALHSSRHSTHLIAKATLISQGDQFEAHATANATQPNIAAAAIVVTRRSSLTISFWPPVSSEPQGLKIWELYT
jgi:hypothetical protein